MSGRGREGMSKRRSTRKRTKMKRGEKRWRRNCINSTITCSKWRRRRRR